MEICCVVTELKPNSLDRVKEWATFINDNKSEALLSLKNEGVTVENYFVVSIDTKDYLIGYMRAKYFEVASAVATKSLLEIDAYHQQFKKETCQHNYKTEMLVNLSLISNETGDVN